MKVIFISGCYAKESIEKIQSLCRGKVGVQNAANAFQWSIIKGLVENNASFEVVSFPLLPIYPIRYKSLFSPQTNIETQGRTIGKMYSYCTAIGIKPYSIKYKLRNVIEKRLKSRRDDEETVLLLFTTNSFYTEPIIPLLHKYKNLRIAAIVTDLIDDAYNYKSNQTFLKRIQVKREIKAQKLSYKYIDKYILLTKAMEERIPEAIGRNIVIEGICDRVLEEKIPIQKETELKTILYTGTLQKYVGIDDFVDAFTLTTNPNYRLVICGAGPSENYIVGKSKKDPRIIYKGVVTREEALFLQQRATVLVNPRKPTETITRYSFPSKTIEYLSSGTPMIGYRLEGIPEEYYPYIYTPSDLSTHSMATLINNVLLLPPEELNYKAQRSLEFIMKNKSSEVQVKKIIDFLSL